jgi:hypothetical protein
MFLFISFKYLIRRPKGEMLLGQRHVLLTYAGSNFASSTLVIATMLDG